MSELSAYIAVSSFVRGRRVLVVHPQGPAGPRLLVEWGAARVFVVGDRVDAEPGISVRAAGTRLPLQDASVDLVLCLDAIDQFDAAARAELLPQIARVLRTDGTVVIRVPRESGDGVHMVGDGPPRHEVPFWSLRDEMEQLFGPVSVISQVPWTGHSFAPVLDEDGGEDRQGETNLSLREDLLDAVPQASHYLCVAGSDRHRSHLEGECVLVPVRSELGPIEGLRDLNAHLSDELEQLRDELAMRSARIAAADARVRDLEVELAASLAAESKAPELATAEEFEARIETLATELNRVSDACQLSEARRQALAQECERLRVAAGDATSQAHEPCETDGDSEQANSEEDGPALASDRSHAVHAPTRDELRDAEILVLESTSLARERALVELAEHGERLQIALDEQSRLLERHVGMFAQVQREKQVLEAELDYATRRGDALWDRASRAQAELASWRARAEQAGQLDRVAVTPLPDDASGVGVSGSMAQTGDGDGDGHPPSDLAADSASGSVALAELAQRWHQRIVQLQARELALARALVDSQSRARSWRIRASLVEGALLAGYEGEQGSSAPSTSAVLERIDSLATQLRTRLEANESASSRLSGASAPDVSDPRWGGLATAGFDDPFVTSRAEVAQTPEFATDSVPVAAEIDAVTVAASASPSERAEAEHRGVDPELFTETQTRRKIEALRAACGAALLDRNRAVQRVKQWERAWAAERSRCEGVLAELEQLQGLWVVERTTRLQREQNGRALRMQLAALRPGAGQSICGPECGTADRSQAPDVGLACEDEVSAEPQAG